MTKAKVAVYGASGYTAGELFRLLSSHPRAQLSFIASESQPGTPVAHLHPQLGNISNRTMSLRDVNWSDCDCVFFATPNRIAMRQAKELLKQGLLIIDLSADFRIRDLKIWSQWYGEGHDAPALVKDAAYGLPEANRTAIAAAKLIANPGCYATTIQLGLLPLLAHSAYKTRLTGAQELIVDAKSGTSGAGRQAEANALLSEASENLSCYAAEGHRHQPEMEGFLKDRYDVDVRLRFVPHLVPMARGIFADIYLPLGYRDMAAVRACYEDFYQEEPFVHLVPAGQSPQTKSVRGSNYCQLGLFTAPGSHYIQVCSVVDNLVKGAAGQAIQNMNIALGFPETLGLLQVGLSP